MNILLLVDRFPPSKIGGVWMAVLQLRSAYEKEGHSVFVLTNEKSTALEDQYKIKRTNHGLFLGTLWILFGLRKFCRRHGIDVIHAHQPLSSPALLLLKFLNSRIKIVASFHTTYFSEYRSVVKRVIGNKTYYPAPMEYVRKFITAPMHIFLDFLTYIAADEVTAVSSAVRKEIEQTYGKVRWKEIRVISNGVENVGNRARKMNGSRFVFFAGSFKARKGLWELLNAFSLIEQKDLKLVIAGEGRGYNRRIKREIKRLGIEDRVLLVGKVANQGIISWLSACEIFCLPSLMEGHPLILLEAMSVGAAVVATDIGGVNETIQNGINGILVPPGDYVRLSEAIATLSLDAGRRALLGEAAMKTVESKYRWDSLANQYLEIFPIRSAAIKLHLQSTVHIDCFRQ